MDLSDATHLGRRPTLAFSPHPLQAARDRDLTYAVFLPGETIAAYLERTGIAARMGRQPFVLTIDGRQVPRALWAGCRPKPGTLINLYAIVRGGGGGKKNPMATVLQIALMVAAPGIGEIVGTAAGLTGEAFSLFGQSVTWGRIIGGAISTLGGMAINALLPPPRPNLATAQGQVPGATVSPSYAISGGANRARAYEPMPVLMGTNRYFFDAGARAYTEFHGEDQVLFQVFEAGHNDLVFSDWRIGETPIANFAGVTLEESGADGRLTLFPANVDTIGGGQLELGADWIARTSSPNATGLGVDVSGLLFAVQAHDGAIAHNACWLVVQYRAVGAADWIEQWNEYIVNNSRSPYRKMVWWAVAEGQYEVRVRAHSPAGTGQNYTTELAWSQLRTYQPDTADYTGRKRIALKAVAGPGLQGVVEQLNAIATARTAAWDGASWVAATPTSNPGAWFLQCARGRFAGGRRVWGAGLPDARIDLDSLAAFSAWCAAEGLTFDWIFDQAMSAADMLSAIALCGRGTLTWATGKLGVVWDAPAQPVVGVFGMHNIRAGTFEVEYATEALADEIVAWFINPDLGSQRDSVRARVPGSTGTARVREVQLAGCRNREMAGQLANLYAAANTYRARRYRWQSDREAVHVSRGDVVQLSHDLASLDYSGRFVPGGNSSTLKLPQPVPRYAGGAFVVIVRPNGAFKTFAVAGGSGESATLSLTAALTGGDAPYNPYASGAQPLDFKWLYGPTATPGKKVKVDALRVPDANTVELQAVDEVPEYYTAATNPVTYVPPARRFGGAPVLSNLTVAEEGVRAGSGYAVRAKITWDVAGDDYGFADVRIGVNGGPLQLRAQEVRGKSTEVIAQDGDTLQVRVTGYGSLGRLAAFSTIEATHVLAFAAIARPADVQVFRIDGGVFNWELVDDVDAVGYSIRFHYGDRRTWEDAIALHDGLLTATPWRPATLPSGPLTFLIKAVDAAPLESANAAVILTDLGDPAIANVIETIDLHADGFPGTIANGSLLAGDLVADEVDAFYKADDAAPFYASSDAASFYAGTEYAEMAFATADIVPADPLAGSVLTIVSEIEGAPVYLEYRLSGAAPMYADDDGDAFYDADDGDPFYAPAPGWTPWPGALVVRHEPYQFRVRTGQGAVQGAIRALQLVIDAPDLEEELENVAIGAGGTRLSLATPFRVIANLQLTLQADGGTAVNAKGIDKDAALGPLVKCVDATNAFVAGTVDARVKGY